MIKQPARCVGGFFNGELHNVDVQVPHFNLQEYEVKKAPVDIFTEYPPSRVERVPTHTYLVKELRWPAGGRLFYLVPDRQSEADKQLEIEYMKKQGVR